MLCMDSCRRVSRYKPPQSVGITSHSIARRLPQSESNDYVIQIDDLGQFKYDIKSQTASLANLPKDRSLVPPLSSIMREGYSISPLFSCSIVWTPIASRHQSNRWQGHSPSDHSHHRHPPHPHHPHHLQPDFSPHLWRESPLPAVSKAAKASSTRSVEEEAHGYSQYRGPMVSFELHYRWRLVECAFLFRPPRPAPAACRPAAVACSPSSPGRVG